MAKAFVREGLKVMIANIEQSAPTQGVLELKVFQERAEVVVTGEKGKRLKY